MFKKSTNPLSTYYLFNLNVLEISFSTNTTCYFDVDSLISESKFLKKKIKIKKTEHVSLCVPSNPVFIANIWKFSKRKRRRKKKGNNSMGISWVSLHPKEMIQKSIFPS